MRYDLVGTLTTELLLAVDQAPMLEPKDRYIEKKLEELFGTYDWTRSFQTKQVIVYDEILLSEILPAIHKWLRRKCANIENICVRVNHHPGIKDWWQDWCKVNHQKSFEIEEIFYLESSHRKKKFCGDIAPLPAVSFFQHSKQIQKLFSFYGGKYAKPDRVYLTLKMLEFNDVAEIDFASLIPPKQEILAYAEHILYYSNQTQIDQLITTYDRYVDNGTLRSAPTLPGGKKFEKLKFEGFQWETDRHCWASVIRETINDDCYSCVTEKTLRCFLHHVVAIPVGFKAVAQLEKLGFWFPHEIIDYSYQDQKIFSTRIGDVVDQLNRLKIKYSFAQLQDFYLDNLQNFQHNAELVYKYIDKQESYL